jgi:amino acid transporter
VRRELFIFIIIIIIIFLFLFFIFLFHVCVLACVPVQSGASNRQVGEVVGVDPLKTRDSSSSAQQYSLEVSRDPSRCWL